MRDHGDQAKRAVLHGLNVVDRLLGDRRVVVFQVLESLVTEPQESPVKPLHTPLSSFDPKLSATTDCNSICTLYSPSSLMNSVLNPMKSLISGSRKAEKDTVLRSSLHYQAGVGLVS